MSKVKLTYFAISPIINPILHLRVFGPCKFENMDILWVSEYQELRDEWFHNRQLIVVQRNFPGDLHLYRQIIDRASTLNIPIIYDIDDYLFELPKDHPDKAIIPFVDSLLPMFEALVNADCVTVSSSKLKARVNEYNNNVVMLPNFLDDSLWPFHLPIKKKGEEPLTIGYMGGDSHRPDIKWLTPVLSKINQDFGSKINFHFYGLEPPQELTTLPNVQRTPIRTYDYREFIDDFHHLKFDILIAPLIDNIFNQCKSGIKFLEYSSLGVPGIYSNLEPYSSILRDGENGFLASNLDEWYEKLAELINDSELRFSLARNAQETVRANWLMSKHAQLWTETYNKIIMKGPLNKTKKAVPIDILQSISMQLFDANILRHEIRSKDLAAIKQKEDEVNVLHSQINHLNETHQTLNSKLTGYKNNTELLESRLSQQNGTIQSLNTQLTESKNNNELLSTQLDGLNKKFQVLEQQINHYKSKIGSLNAEISKYAQHNQSLLEQLGKGKITIERLENQVDEFKQRIAECEEEIIFYSLSKSWRYTRPFRKITQSIRRKKDD